METKFNFNSQVATTREQSERLLALGLKKETADMHYALVKQAGYPEWDYFLMPSPITNDAFESIPAWSLSRLLCMIPEVIEHKKDLPTFNKYADLELCLYGIGYFYEDYDGDQSTIESWVGNGLFAAVVDCIKWLIKEGYFNKEYLNNEN